MTKVKVKDGVDGLDSGLKAPAFFEKPTRRRMAVHRFAYGVVENSVWRGYALRFPIG